MLRTAAEPGSMARAYLSVGSNIEPAANLRRALRLLARRVKVMGISTVYETRPEGGRAQPPYYNCVVEVDTEAPPSELKRSVLRAIEDELGRKRGADRFASRTIDLDLILYGDLVVSTEELALPDVEIRERPYLAAGVAELNPQLAMPDAGERIADIAASLAEKAPRMKALRDYTRELRRDIVNGYS
ncbi:MAG: 2-amino-4-hydroxy-6-hydroxymethyldihydropteridine diphosphokinase [Armatimonadota bacterium]